jgi:2Fe-2S ferredoxin
MTRITYIDTTGVAQTHDVANGLSVMQGGVDNNVRGIAAECGGAAACATCRVYVAADWVALLAPRKQLENSMLDDEDPDYDRLRLSCQIEVVDALDGLIVTVAEN